MNAASIADDLLEDDVDDDRDGADQDVDGDPDGDLPSVDGDRDAGTAGTSPSSDSGIVDRFLSTEPNLSLSDPSLQDAVDVENGGLPRVKRGLYKLTNTEGATAAEDIVIGTIEWWMQKSGGAASSSDEVDDVQDEPMGPVVA